MNDGIVILLAAALALYFWKSKTGETAAAAKDQSAAERPNISIGRVGSDYILEPGLAGLAAQGKRTGGVGASGSGDAVGSPLRYTGPENNPRTSNQPA
jgi:hypothetical protein